jgi:hypothetical protein
MSKKALKTLWSFFGLAGLTFSMLAWFRNNGQSTDSDVFGILELAPPEVPVLALPAQLALLTLVLVLTHVWARSVDGRNWADRVPVFYFENEDVSPLTLGGRIYQGSLLIAFVIVPVLLLLNMGAHYLKADIFFAVKGGTTTAIGITPWGHFDVLLLYAFKEGRPGFFRFENASGPQYYPLATWVYAMWCTLNIIYLVVALKAIFLPRRFREEV